MLQEIEKPKGASSMIPELKALIVEYQMYFGLETIEEARNYIRKDLRYLEEQERGYVLIGKTEVPLSYFNSVPNTIQWGLTKQFDPCYAVGNRKPKGGSDG